MTKSLQRDRIAGGRGFIAALDQSGGSTPKALALYGVDASEYDGEEAMFAEIQKMRARIMQAPDFHGDHVIGAILFERTLGESISGRKVPDFLWNGRGIVPFLKIDRGLAPRAGGVQLMNPIPGLAGTLEAAAAQGVFGTKERSVIHQADRDGIRAVVEQQFDLARDVIGAGMVPIIEPEVDIHSPTKSRAEEILKEEIRRHLDGLPDDVEVMLKLTLPSRDNLYADLVDHPRVLRVVALSGGYSTRTACRLLARNRGMIASFSRALTEGLKRSLTDAEFNDKLADNIRMIRDASLAG